MTGTTAETRADTVKIRAAIIEILGTSVLIFLMLGVALGSFSRLRGMFPLPDVLAGLDLAGEGGAFAFASLVCLLAIIRHQPLSSAKGWLPWSCAIGGAFILTAVNYLPATPLPAGFRIASFALLATGNILAVVCLARLGRSFSVLPQARRLVTSGPYGRIRHPLYVAEAVATLGMILAHFGWLAVILGVVQFALQWGRIVYEERTLLAAFPEYAGYARRVPRFIPRFRGGFTA